MLSPIIGYLTITAYPLFCLFLYLKILLPVVVDSFYQLITGQLDNMGEWLCSATHP